MLVASMRTNVSGIGSGGQPLIEKHPKTLHIFFKVTPSNVNSPGNANPYVAGGDALDLTAVFGTAGLPGYSFPTASLTEKVEIQSVQTPGVAAQFEYQYVPGTTLANGKMQVLTGAAAQSGLAELSAGNYPAAVLADVIEGEMIIPVP
jgi:hypothetical protein